MKRIICLITAFAMCLTAFSLAGCKRSTPDTENTLEIKLYDGGYGFEWFDTICARFKEQYPETEFIVDTEIAYGNAQTFLSAGPNVTTTDLFMGSEPVMKYVLYGDTLLRGYDCVLEELDDVYESLVPGENIKVKDKMIKGFEQDYRMFDNNGEEHYYSYPWMGGAVGIVYNKTQFDALQLREPRTTDELFDVVCAKLKDAGKTPFVTSVATPYDYSTWAVWHNQYHGRDGMDLYYQCKVFNEDSGRAEYSELARKDKGELYWMSTIEKQVGVRYGNMHPNVNTMTFTQAQAQLLLGNAMMYVCGDWLENEMKNSHGNGDVLKYMKTPIISEIIEKTPSIKTDEVLRQVISYIDGEAGAATPESLQVTAEDVETIRTARRLESLATFQAAYIPTYATAKELAKEFLRFMATDEAIKICLDATNGASVPFQYDIRSDSERWNGYSEFIKSRYDLIEDVEMVVDQYKYPLTVFGSIESAVNDPKYKMSMAKFTAKNEKDRVTAEQIFEDRQTYFTRARLDRCLQRAGLI